MFHKLSDHKAKYFLSSTQFLWLGNFFQKHRIFPNNYLRRHTYGLEISREHPFLRHFQFFVVLVKMVKSTVPYILLVLVPAQQKKIPEIQVRIPTNHKLWEKHINAWVSTSISVTCQYQFRSTGSALSQSMARLLLSRPTSVSETTWQKHKLKSSTFQLLLVFKDAFQK